MKTIHPQLMRIEIIPALDVTMQLNTHFADLPACRDLLGAMVRALPPAMRKVISTDHAKGGMPTGGRWAVTQARQYVGVEPLLPPGRGDNAAPLGFVLSLPLVRMAVEGGPGYRDEAHLRRAVEAMQDRTLPLAEALCATLPEMQKLPRLRRRLLPEVTVSARPRVLLWDHHSYAAWVVTALARLAAEGRARLEELPAAAEVIGPPLRKAG